MTTNMALDKALHKHSYSSEKNYYEYDQRYSLIWIYSTYSEFPCLIVYRSETPNINDIIIITIPAITKPLLFITFSSVCSIIIYLGLTYPLCTGVAL